ncbi:MAG: hypothetical protein HOL85_04760 [Rhodospirillaceae bacterium]|nr:hypothetical protein [Rhodospirillaceae bacterium]MBT6136813.1 hypothetical protein [Rhodospirillaceae bacterium]
MQASIYWLMRLMAVMVLALIIATPASALRIQWYVEVLAHPVTRKPVLEARVLTQRGFRFHVGLHEDRSVWGEFRLPRSSRDQLTTNRLPIYWIDDNDPIDLDKLKQLEVGFTTTLFKHEGQNLKFIIWGSTPQGFIPPTLRQMMLGEKLHVRYWTLMGEKKMVEIPLNRANAAIAQFLKVQPLDRKSAKKQEPAKTFSVIAKRYLEVCDELRYSGNDRDYGTCRERFVLCSESPEQTAESYKGCLGFSP